MSGVVPNATVVVENVATGTKTTVNTDNAGEYRAGNLLVGQYKVTVTANGFSTASVENIDVQLNLVSTVNVNLKVGGISTNVEITAAAAQIDTTTAQITNVFSRQLAEDLPVTSNTANGTGIFNLSLLGAGVASSGGIGVGVGPSIAGQRTRNNSFNIEGVDNNRKDVTGYLAHVPNDTVSEFTVIQNQFSAEYGHSSGGQFNIVIKNGTNDLHGGLWEYLENKKLNAVDQAYARQYTNPIPPAPRFDRNRLGAMIGGPIKKNKLFYFGSYEYQPFGQAPVAGSPTYAPTAAGYAALSNISSVNPTLLGILKQYLAPAPVQAAGAAGKTTVAGVTIPIGILPISSPAFQNLYYWLVSVDYNLSDKDQLRARYVDNKTSQIDTTANLPVFYTSRPTTAHIGTFQEFHTFSPTVTNELRLAYNRYNDNIVVPNFKFQGLDQFPNILIENDLNLQLGPNPNAPQATIQNTYQLVDNVSWVKGKHELKFGFDGRDLLAASTFIQRVRGDYDYSTLDLFLRDQFPDVLAQRNVGGRPYSGNLTQYYLFANDNYRYNSHLTLDLGIRYEFNGVAQSMKLFDLDAIANTPGVLTFQAPKPQKTNFAPRVGFAYSPGNSGASSIRGGFGIAYDQVFDNVGTNATPPQASATVNSDPSQYPTGGFLASGGITQNAVPSSLTPALARAATSSYLPPLQKQGYALTWTISYQRVFHKDYTFESRYIGNKGVHLLFQTQINRNSLVTPTVNLPLFYSAPAQATLNSLAYGICPAAGAAPTCITVGSNQNTLNNPLLPYGYTSTITGYEPLGNSIYHGWANQLTRRFSDNLLFIAAYTWSHAIDDSTSEVNSTTLTPRRPQNFGNLSAERATSALDHRQRFTLTPLYNVPYFAGDKNWLKRNLLGNWRLSGVYTYETGELVTPQSASDANLNGDSAGDRVVINLSGTPGTSSTVTALKNANGATVAYLASNPSGYYVKALAGMYANSGRNILPTLPIDNFDFNIAKLFSIREKTRLEIRADFYNVLNHAQYTTGIINNVYQKQHIGETNYLTPGNPLFGQWDQVFSSNPRRVQIGAKVTW
jgi:hypothetical protein